jgi:hypothetical protein
VKNREFSLGHGVKNRKNFPVDMEWKTERIFPWTLSEKHTRRSDGTLNRGLVCVTRIRSYTDLKDPDAHVLDGW